MKRHTLQARPSFYREGVNVSTSGKRAPEDVETQLETESLSPLIPLALHLGHVVSLCLGPERQLPQCQGTEISTPKPKGVRQCGQPYWPVVWPSLKKAAIIFWLAR